LLGLDEGPLEPAESGLRRAADLRIRVSRGTLVVAVLAHAGWFLRPSLFVVMRRFCSFVGSLLWPAWAQHRRGDDGGSVMMGVSSGAPTRATEMLLLDCGFPPGVADA
jgi:hypothetical protein